MNINIERICLLSASCVYSNEIIRKLFHLLWYFFFHNYILAFFFFSSSTTTILFCVPYFRFYDRIGCFFRDATCLSICKRIVKKKRREQKLETSAIWSLVFRIGKTVRPVSPFRPGFPSCLVPHPRLDTFLAYRCTRVGRERVGWRKVGWTPAAAADPWR